MIVSIMPRKLQLDNGLPEFEPISRHAILVNNYDLTEFFTPPYTHLDYSRGNRRVYEMEAMLKGKFSDGPNMWRAMMRTGLPEMYQHELEIHHARRKDIPYDSVTRILPKTQMRRKLDRKLLRIAGVANDNTLTFVYITSHGNVGTFAIDDRASMRYEDLLDRLDRIKGKKVIVCMACYSGSLIDSIEARHGRDNYIALTSTPNDEEGVNWGEDNIHDIVIKNLSCRRRLSDIALPPDSEGTHPQIYGNYDVKL